MDTKTINELAEIMKKNGVTLIEINEKDISIKLERTIQVQTISQSVALESAITASTADESSKTEPDVVNFNNIKELKSQMVGTFYGTPAPDEEPFVKIGDKVKKGDVLCIIEAMKLMNEFVAEQDGEIVDICAKDGQLVEFGQCLFKIY